MASQDITYDEAMADILAAVKNAGIKEPPKGYCTFEEIAAAWGKSERWVQGKIRAALAEGTLERYPEKISNRWYYRAVKK
jgi:hypothetical protein